MLQKDGVFPYGLVDIFMVIDHHCIIILRSEIKISYACSYAMYANVIHSILHQIFSFFLTLSMNITLTS